MNRTIKGILLILAGVCIILAAIGMPLGYIQSLGLSFVDVLFTILGLFFLLGILKDRNYSAIPFPLMLIFFFLEDNIALWLGKEDDALVSNWLVFGCGILISIGISMLGTPKKAKRMETSEIKCGSYGKFRTSFGAASKYIDCMSFSHLDFSVRCGEGILYFENPESYTGDGVLDVFCCMGSMKIYVPNGWHLDVDIKSELADTELPSVNFPDGPTLTVRGKNSLGSIEICYR